MGRHRDNEETPTRKRGQRRCRPNAEKRRGAREILRDVEWLDWPRIYWSGCPAANGHTADLLEIRFPLRRVKDLVAERVRSLPAGPYAVSISPAPSSAAEPADCRDDVRQPVTISTVDIQPIDLRLISKSARAIQFAQRFPKELPRAVGDVARWRRRANAALREVSNTLRALEAGGGGPTRDLSPEGHLLWIGENSTRPSVVLSSDSIVAAADDRTSPATNRLAAILIGSRRINRVSASSALGGFVGLGRVLSNWPADLVLALSTKSGLKKALNIARQNPAMNTTPIANAVLESFLLDPKQDPLDEVSGWLEVADAIRLAIEEWEVRRGIAKTIICKIGQRQDGFRPPSRDPGKVEAKFRSKEDLAGSALDRLPKEPAGCDLLDWDGQVSRWLSIEDSCLQLIGSFPTKREWALVYMNCRDSWDSAAEDIVDMLTALWKGVAEKYEASLDCALSFLTQIRHIGTTREQATWLAKWIDACRLGCAPGESGTDAVCLALSVAGFTCHPAQLEPKTRSSALCDLSAHGSLILKKVFEDSLYLDEILTYGPCRAIFESFKEEQILSVLRSSFVLSEGSLPIVIRGDLWSAVATLIADRPSVLSDYFDWIRATQERVLDGRNSSLEEELVLAPAKDAVPLFRYAEPSDLRAIVGALNSHTRSACELPEFVRLAADFIENVGCSEDFSPPDDQKNRLCFLGENFPLFDNWLKTEQALVTKWHLDEGERELRQWGLDFIEFAYHWWLAGHASMERLAESVFRGFELQGPPKQNYDKWLDVNWHDIPLLIDLSGGEVSRVVPLVKALRNNREYPLRRSNAWAHLAGFEGAQTFVRHCVDRPELIPRLWRLLQRLALALRLESAPSLDDAIRSWQLPTCQSTPLVSDIAVRHRDNIQLLHAYRKMAGMPGDLPPGISRILNLGQSAREEVKSLERRSPLPQGPAKRFEMLKELLESPDSLSKRINDDLDKLLFKKLQAAKLAALEAAVASLIQRHWEQVLGSAREVPEDPDWDNAFIIFLTTKKNRRLTREILRQEISGADERPRRWILDHPGNQRFLQQAHEGRFDAEGWLKEITVAVDTPSGPLTAFTEYRPLKILQMGNLFGTCLGTFNAFATVANAYEINKKVLYLEDRRGRVLGRKLIAISADGAIYGFQTYGSADLRYPWVKIAADLLCAQIANASDAHLAGDSECDVMNGLDREPLRLFCEWYSDDTEAFDWWVLKGYHQFSSGFDFDLVAKEILTEFNTPGHDRESLLRSILVLANRLVDVDEFTEALEDELEESELKFLRQNTLSRRFRDSLGQGENGARS